jgi:hypothetical protein
VSLCLCALFSERIPSAETPCSSWTGIKRPTQRPSISSCLLIMLTVTPAMLTFTVHQGNFICAGSPARIPCLLLKDAFAQPGYNLRPRFRLGCGMKRGNHLGHGVAWADYTASRQKDAHGLHHGHGSRCLLISETWWWKPCVFDMGRGVGYSWCLFHILLSLETPAPTPP